MRLPTFTAAASLRPAQGSYRTKFPSSARSYLVAQAQPKQKGYYVVEANVSKKIGYEPGYEQGWNQIETLLEDVVSDPNLRKTSLGQCLQSSRCNAVVTKGIHKDKVGDHITVSYSYPNKGDFGTQHVWVRSAYNDEWQRMEYYACAVGDYYGGTYSNYVQQAAMTFAQDCSNAQIAQQAQ